MTVEKMDVEVNGNGNIGSARDEDTEEFSDAELAFFIEQSNEPQMDKNGDLQKPWARLVSVDKSYSSIDLWDDEVRLGRADVVKFNGEEDMHVSKTHCRIWRDEESGSCYIQNLSVNGTLVQGKSVEKGHEVMVSQGDEISLGPLTSGCPLFVFRILCKFQSGHQKRAIEVEVDSGSHSSIEKAVNGPDPKKPKMIENVDTFKCSICLNVWHDVISVTPCLHSFCNSCFSDWYRKSSRDRAECICPQCRATVSSVSRNHTLRSLVEDLLKEDPSLGRSPEDVIEMDKNALFKSGSTSQFQFGNHHSDEEDEEDEEEEHGCVQCVAGQGQFQCVPGQSHLTCASCERLYPERSDVDNVVQKCQVCSKAYCKTYWESQQLNAFDSAHCPKILPLNQRELFDMPSRAHHSNLYEQEVTRQYIAEHGLTVQAVLSDWLGRLDSGEADQPRSLSSFQSRVSSHTAVCDSCAVEVHSHLLDKFRTNIPKTELPPDAAGRPDCWYGHACRTQYHKDAHARKLNHVCEPSRQSIRSNAAVQL